MSRNEAGRERDAAGAGQEPDELFFLNSSSSSSRRRWPAAGDAGNDTRLYLDQTAGEQVCMCTLSAGLHPSTHPSVHPSQPLSPNPPPLAPHHSRPPEKLLTRLSLQMLDTVAEQTWASGPASPSEPSSPLLRCTMYNTACLLVRSLLAPFPPDSTDGGHVALVVCGASHLPGPRCSPWPVGMLACPLPPSASALTG